MNMQPTEKQAFCVLCGRRVDQGRGHYILRMEIFAADEPPEKLMQFDDQREFRENVDRLLAEIAQMDSKEIEESVYKFLKFDLCRSCQHEFLKNPLGRR